MKKICFLTSCIESTGGTERVSIMLANKLTELGYDVCFFNLIGGNKVKFEINKEIKIYTLNLPPHSTKKNFFKIICGLRNYIKSNSISTIIDVDSILCVFSTIAKIGLPVRHICWEHFNFNEDLGVAFRGIGRILAARYADVVVTLTERDKELWKEKLKVINTNMIAIPNPTPYESIVNEPQQSFKTVLSIGRLTYQKGFDYLIEAWALVCEKHPEWQLVIVGSGEDELQLKQKVQELNLESNINFFGPTKEIESFYRKASFYCMSSRFEGLPMVLLEAQAYGLPIVSFNCDTGPAEVIKQGYNGILVECFNTLKLADALIEMIMIQKDQFQKVCNNSFLNIKRFELDSLISQWVEVLGDK